MKTLSSGVNCRIGHSSMTDTSTDVSKATNGGKKMIIGEVIDVAY